MKQVVFMTLEPGMAANDWHYGRSNNGIGGSGDAGPAAKYDNWKNTDKQYFGNAQSYLQYSIIEGLDLKTFLGADFNDTQNLEYRLLGFDSRARDSQTFRDQTDLLRTSISKYNYFKLYKNFCRKA